MAKVQKIEATRDGRTRFFHPVTWDAMKEDPKTGHPHMGYTRVSKREEMPTAKKEVVIPASVEKAIKAGRPKKEDDDVNN
jgi:hypothetical protein